MPDTTRHQLSRRYNEAMPDHTNFLTTAQTTAGPLPVMVTPGEGVIVLTATEYAQRRDSGMDVRDTNLADIHSLAPIVYVPRDCAHSGHRTRFGHTGTLRSGWYQNGTAL